MRGYTVARIWGIPIRINTSLLVFLPILAYLIGSGQQIELYAGLLAGFSGVGFDLATLRAGTTPWTIGVVAAVGLFVSVLLHELGHSWAAMRYGIEIESITLWILGGLASLKTLPKEWNRELWIAVAGPAVSVLLGVVCYVGMVLTPASLAVPRFLLGYLAITNVVLTVFNLLPAFPMDGGRVFRALLARTRPYGTATRLAARVGVVFAFLFGIVGVFTFQIILVLLAWFIYSAATTESRTVLLDELLDGISVGDIMTRDPPTVSGDTTVEAFGRQLLSDRQPVHLVVDDDGAPLGVVTLESFKRVEGRDRATVTLSEVAQELSRIDADADAFDTLAQLSAGGTTRALVEDDGRLVGVLSESDYASAITIRRGFRSASV
ncbi:site-2 protease family protein [Halobaculum litoreum]|uniref:site-2 protease family protein n=1 Tax=Halobaculum litoreum TaxID=3031998 RepID=UPI0024C21568|nr:site-2 protease family protein [Halobaculum sp. DT92]